MRLRSSDMPRLTLSGRPANEVAADLLVLPVAAGDGGPVAPPVTRAVLALAGADLAALGRDRQLGGDLDQSLLLPTYGRLGARALLLLGVGRDSGRSLETLRDRKSTRLNSSHITISYAVFCLKKK